ncbi:MAG: enoyl-CoA hydratase/isomerase family protein [Dehalococcoidia bacterium]
MSFETVTYERRGNVAWLTMNRPEALNAMNADLRRDLKLAWEEVRHDRDVWVAVLTGTGTRGFCAGADLREMQGPVPWTTPTGCCKRPTRWKAVSKCGSRSSRLSTATRSASA